MWGLWENNLGMFMRRKKLNVLKKKRGYVDVYDYVALVSSKVKTKNKNKTQTCSTEMHN